MINALIGLVLFIVLVGPALWTLHTIWRDGVNNLHPANWLSLFFRLFFLAPGVLAVYWFQTKQPLMGVMAFSVYVFILWQSGVWGSIFQTLKLGSGGAGDDQVRRGSRVVDARTTGGKRGSVESEDVAIGGVIVPRDLEAQHFLISGTTGSGKTQVINGMLRSIRKRGNRAVIADPAGGFYARFGQANDDLINPFDKRSVKWSPFAEIRADYDCERIAKAIIPDGTGSGGEWHHYAQMSAPIES